jgi:hypothetical protein
MEPIKTTNDHTCTPGHCCACDGCGVMCKRDHQGERNWVRHFVILIVGVIAAFFIGYYLGKLKGYVMAQYDMPMRAGEQIVQ